MRKFLKAIYGKLSRFPGVARLREAWRKNIELRYWPWYRRKPAKCGIEPDATRYKHELIVSLTSFPARIHLVHFAIYSLLRQSLKPNRIVLWLADEQFPRKEADLPKTLLDLKPLGLEIRWCEDIKSFKKLIPALRVFSEAIIVTADDDLYYPRDWLKSLYQSWLDDETCVHCCGMRQITWDASGKINSYGLWTWNPPDVKPGYKNTQLGGYGALYPPHSLHPDVVNTELLSRLSPTADDLWFWTMTVRAGTKIQLVQKNRQQTILIPDSLATPRLWSQNHSGGGNDRCIAQLFQAFPELPEKLEAERAGGKTC